MILVEVLVVIPRSDMQAEIKLYRVQAKRIAELEAAIEEVASSKLEVAGMRKWLQKSKQFRAPCQVDHSLGRNGGTCCFSADENRR